MYLSCLAKQQALKSEFLTCKNADARYQKIMELGKRLPALDPSFKTAENLVAGCQSQMYLRAYLKEGKIYFEAQSDALISAGLAALLILVYSDETPETILKCPPDYIKELGIPDSLTPSRANGLYSMHMHMKRLALALLLKG